MLVIAATVDRGVNQDAMPSSSEGAEGISLITVNKA